MSLRSIVLITSLSTSVFISGFPLWFKSAHYQKPLYVYTYQWNRQQKL